MAKSSKVDSETLLNAAKTHVENVLGVEGDMLEKVRDDLRFAFGDDFDQWDETIRNDRGTRPCYTFNRVEPAIDQVVGDQIESTPMIKVRAVEDSGVELADTYNGLIRNIHAMSDADTVFDEAFKNAVAGGLDYWTIMPEFANDDDFNQDLFIRATDSPFSVYMDAFAKHPTKKDSNEAAISWWISEKKFHKKYPGKVADDFDFSTFDEFWFNSEKGVRILSYFRRTKVSKTLIQLQLGDEIRNVIESDSSDILDELEEQGWRRVRDRKVEGFQVEWSKLSGADILEGPITYQWKRIPIVRLVGKRLKVDGKERIKGLTRSARDSQQAYNYVQSSITERTLNAPSTDLFATPKMVKGLTGVWDTMTKKMRSWIPFNPDPALPGGPLKVQNNDIQAGLIVVGQQLEQNIFGTTQHFPTSLGAQGNEVSGTAIQGREVQSDKGSLIYTNNFKAAIKATAEMLVDMIPTIYDSERTIRILNADGEEDFVDINVSAIDEEKNQKNVVKDIKGKFDITVSITDPYATQREEASDKLLRLGERVPSVLEDSADIVVKGLDIPDGDEIEKRTRKRLIAQGVIKPNEKEEEEIKEDQENQQPNPMEQLQLQTMQTSLEKMQAEIEKLQSETEENRADVVRKLADARDKTSDTQLKAIQPLESIDG